jgi:hypothetical protein
MEGILCLIATEYESADIPLVVGAVSNLGLERKRR